MIKNHQETVISIHRSLLFPKWPTFSDLWYGLDCILKFVHSISIWLKEERCQHFQRSIKYYWSWLLNSLQRLKTCFMKGLEAENMWGTCETLCLGLKFIWRLDILTQILVGMYIGAYCILFNRHLEQNKNLQLWWL